MPPVNIVNISSEDEDGEVQIIAINKRHKRKRRKVLDSVRHQADVGNNEQNSSEAPLVGFGVATDGRIPQRARSADILSSKFTNKPAVGRSRSVPQEFTKTTSASSLLSQIAQRSASTGFTPSTPIYQSSSGLHVPATSSTKQTYPTSGTAASPNSGRQFVDFLSSSPPGSEEGTISTAARGKALIFDGRTICRASPEIVRAATLPNPFDRSIRTENSNSFTKRLMQVRKESSNSLAEQAVTSRISRGLLTKPVPLSSSIQGPDIEIVAPRIKDAVTITSSRSEHSSNSKKRKRHAATVEQTTPQSPVRNRVLWSIPAFKPAIQDQELLPQAPTAKHTASSVNIEPSSPAASQEPTKPKPRKTWTSKMYADLAQQLQQCFPFADFARKHSRSEKEVFDVFSAVVQLPLLQKSSTGLSRVSPPGHQSMKAFKNLMKEAKSVLAQEKKKEMELKKGVMKSGSTTEYKESGRAGNKTPSKGLLNIAVRAKSPTDARLAFGMEHAL
ncbi:MAG: hypothetical protein M1830_000288 [Pleopsidium flavum]|nr:MAG: hypothetical protein M1830_000288 [Pleopsidium flavum]